MYKKPIMKLPLDFVVGAEVGIVGEGLERFVITDIVNTDSGVDVNISSGWREPLSKMFLLRGRSHQEAYDDPTSWIDVAVGECDRCCKRFPDSCAYHKVENDIVCVGCHKHDDSVVTFANFQLGKDISCGR